MTTAIGGPFGLDGRVFVLIAVHDLMLAQISQARESALANLAAERLALVHFHVLEETGLVEVLFITFRALVVFFTRVSAQVVV